MKKVKRCLFLTSAIVMAIVSTSTNDVLVDSNADGGELTIWSTHSLEKVLKDPNYNHNNVQLKAELDIAVANGETESGQIIVTTGDKEVKEYKIETADLTNEAGDIYAAKNVEVFHQYYARVDKKSHTETLNADYFPAHDPSVSLYSGYTPDALIPQNYSIEAKENCIARNSNQGITFDFHVPAGTPAGEYSGSFTLKIDEATYSIPVTLNVWGFDLSSTHGMNLWDIVDGLEAIGEMSSDYQNLYDTYYEALLKYKLNAYHFNAHTTDDEVDWVNDLRKYSKAPAFGGVFLPDMGGERSRIYRYFAEIAKACIEDEINYFSKIRFYHQEQDEPHDKSGMLDQTVTVVNSTSNILSNIAKDLGNGTLNDASDQVVEGFDGLNTFLKEEIIESITYMPQIVTTYYRATDALHGIVSAFTPGIKHYETDWDERMYEYNAEITNGEQWFYTSLYPEYPRPAYRIDDYSLAGRVQGWMKKDWNVFGYLNWACNIYGGVRGSSFLADVHVIDPYENPVRFDSNGRHFSNGDGYMFYPMAKYHADSPLPSIRLLTARDGQEDYDMLWTLEEAYRALGRVSKYNVGSDFAVENLNKTLNVYYEMLYNGLIYNTSSSNFERVRRSIGGLTEAATDESQTMIMQTSSNNGENAMLRIYSQAQELWINGKKLSKTGDYYPYSVLLNDGRNSVDVKYIVDGQTKSFEYIVFNKIYAYDMSSMSNITSPTKGDSTVILSNKVLSFNVLSYGSKVAELTATKLDYVIPFSLDFAKVHNLNLELKNTCGENISFEILVRDANNKLVKIDETIIFAYETYNYSLNHLYAKMIEAKAEGNSLVFRYPNYTTDSNGKAIPLPKRTFEIRNITYSLK